MVKIDADDEGFVANGSDDVRNGNAVHNDTFHMSDSSVLTNCDQANAECANCVSLAQNLLLHRAFAERRYGKLMRQVEDAECKAKDLQNEVELLRQKYNSACDLLMLRARSATEGFNLPECDLVLKSENVRLTGEVVALKEQLEQLVASNTVPVPVSQKADMDSMEKQEPAALPQKADKDVMEKQELVMPLCEEQESFFQDPEMMTELAALYTGDIAHSAKKAKHAVRVSFAAETMFSEQMADPEAEDEFFVDPVTESRIEEVFCILCGKCCPVRDLRLHLKNDHLHRDVNRDSGMAQTEYSDVLSHLILSHCCYLMTAEGKMGIILNELRKFIRSGKLLFHSEALNASVFEQSMLSTSTANLQLPFVALKPREGTVEPSEAFAEAINSAFRVWFKRIDISSLASSISTVLHQVQCDIQPFVVLISKYFGISTFLPARCASTRQFNFYLSTLELSVFENGDQNDVDRILLGARKIIDAAISSCNNLNLDRLVVYKTIATWVQSALNSVVHWHVFCGKSGQVYVHFPSNMSNHIYLDQNGISVYAWRCNCKLAH